MSYVLAVNWIAKPGKEEEVREILEQLAPEARKEPGALVFTTHRNPQNPREFFLYERYRDEAAFEAHQQTVHFKHLVLERALPLLESRVRQFYHVFGEA